MPYMNKRNRFVQAAKTYAEANLNGDFSNFKKSDLVMVAQSINMKGIPTWVMKECKSAVSKGIFDLTALINAVPVNS
jgi:hypothetical protein